MLKIIVISDLHGELIKINEPFDLLLMCGDGEPIWDQSRRYHREWLNTDFVEWVNNLPFKDASSKVVMIAGNHSFCLEGISKKQKQEWLSKMNGRLVYLDNELYVHKEIEGDIKIFGCPYCKPLHGWPFTRDNLEKYYRVIPNDIDILLTHEAPDILNGGMSTNGRCIGRNFGNKLLADIVLEKKPKYHFFGHIHSSPLKQITEYEGIKFANASILNEDYEIEYNPIVFDYNFD